jgi:hypothetical protein
MSFFKEALKPKHSKTIRKSAHKQSGRQRIYLSGFIQPSKSVTRKGRHSFGSIFGKPAKQRSVKRVAGKRQTIVIRRQPLLAPPMRQVTRQRQYGGISDFIQAPPVRQQVVAQPQRARVMERVIMQQPQQRQPFASRGIDDLIQPPRQQAQGQMQGEQGLIQHQPSQVSQQVDSFFHPPADLAEKQARTRQEIGEAGQNLYKGARIAGEKLYGGAKFAYGKAQEFYQKIKPEEKKPRIVSIKEPEESVEPTGSEEYQAEEFAEETTQPERNKPKYY